MRYTIQAACGCDIGRVRRNNEDNFFFHGQYLEADNDGIKDTICIDNTLKHGTCYAIFDGMGGENFGEVASHAAAFHMLSQMRNRNWFGYLTAKKKYLYRMVQQLNGAVLKAKRDLCTSHMGCTMVSLYFSGMHAFVCNVGDSRAYRVSAGKIEQLSVDHLEKRPGVRKAPLTQYLGIDEEEMLLMPHIAKAELKRGDWYLLCSDGLTDMVTASEIADIMVNCDDAQTCVRKLIGAALERGGRDNITVIVCKVEKNRRGYGKKSK